jgi:aspartyl-tRNA(Asn)/glutamyl-tRNA(Gln) amidotransferase subunit A
MAANPVFLSIRALGDLLRTRKVSPVEITQIFLNRLEEMGPRYNAVVTVTRDLALQQAKQAESEIGAGVYKGPLHGIPYGAKDLLATAGGIPTTWGAACFRNRCFDFDATVIRKLRDSGAILAAKLAMVELAGGMGYRQPNASFTGPGINPWDPTRWSGGSSSGPGSAVSAGLIPYAIGSETWGSILGPANHCGVTGLRPTYGRVSRYGAMTLCWTLDKLGPIGLTADDCGLILQGIAGSDPKDPTTLKRSFSYDSGMAARPFKLGIIRNVADGTSDPMRRNFEAAVIELKEIATIDEVTLSDLPYDEIARTILFAETSSAFEDFIASGETASLTAPEDQYTPYTRMVLSARDYIRALRLREIVNREIDAVMARFDALVGPSRPTCATKLDADFPSALRGAAKDTMGAIGNLSGLPAISVPSGFSAEGVPTGIQFMGRAYEENAIIAVARAYQSLTPWHLRHPPEVLSQVPPG